MLQPKQSECAYASMHNAHMTLLAQLNGEVLARLVRGVMPLGPIQHAAIWAQSGSVTTCGSGGSKAQGELRKR